MVGGEIGNGTTAGNRMLVLNGDRLFSERTTNQCEVISNARKALIAIGALVTAIEHMIERDLRFGCDVGTERQLRRDNAVYDNCAS